VGGLRRDSEVRADGPLAILYSEDLERSVDAITAAGGTIVEPIYAFPAGAGSISPTRPAMSSPSGRIGRRPRPSRRPGSATAATTIA
jgi:predicted enzyme related to lactoylglutathione lyase